jgi:SP family facilitated glucose transporter-like MFS transporter 8
MNKWSKIISTNAVLTLGVLLTLVDEFWVLCVGKFIYGLATGAFTVYCPKYIAEVAPLEVKGPSGGLVQLSITFGILLAFTVGLGVGDVDEDEQSSFEIQYFWYILFLVPLLISIL